MNPNPGASLFSQGAAQSPGAASMEQLPPCCARRSSQLPAQPTVLTAGPWALVSLHSALLYVVMLAPELSL